MTTKSIFIAPALNASIMFKNPVPRFSFLVFCAIAPCAVIGSMPQNEVMVTYDRTVKNQAGIRKSDLSIRILNNKSGPIPKEEAWRDWQANRLEWTYANDPSFFEMIHAQGGTCAGAIASGTEKEDQALVAFDGKKITAGARYRGCMNNPEFISKQLATIKAWAQRGVDSIQHDENLTNFTSFNYGWASCFCDFCMPGFTHYCKDRNTAYPPHIITWDNFNYGDYLKKEKNISSNEEYEEMRASLPLAKDFERYQAWVCRRYEEEVFKVWEGETKKHLTLSMNMVSELAGTFGLSYCPVLDHLDYIIGELYVDKKTVAEWVHSSRLADALNLEFIASIKKIAELPSVSETRNAIALSYAMGRHVLLPWDIYIHGAPRWYGDSKDYQDIISFITENKNLFDGYQPFYNTTILVPFAKDEYEPGLLALTKEMMNRGILCSYSLSGSDRNGFVHIPVNANDFIPDASVWLAGKKEDFSSADRADLDKLIHQNKPKYQGQILPKLFLKKREIQIQVQALHDTNANASKQKKPKVKPVQEFSLLEPLAKDAVERMINSAVKPVYRVSNHDEIFILPRVKEDGNSSTAIHVVNTGLERSNEKIWLDQQLFGQAAPTSAKIHRPAQEPVLVDFKAEGRGWSLVLPTMKEWAIVTVETGK